MSGGVDSATAAALLVREGHDVRGVFMRQYDAPRSLKGALKVACGWEQDRADALKVCAHLNIPFTEWNLTKEYKRKVVDYMFAEYKAGRTPNPDVMCNSFIKFGVGLERALKEGADMVATGHYAQIKTKSVGGKTIYELHAGKDKNKDQSYFLYGLTQKQLKRCIFPISHLLKPKVRELAKKFGLPNSQKKDSQGICFVGQVPMSEFLATKIKPREGDVINATGEVVGRHQGAWYFTNGQRHGLGLFGGETTYFVVDRDLKKNIVFVGSGKDKRLFNKELSCAKLSWTATKPTLPFTAKARIRYRQPLEACEVSIGKAGTLKVIFKRRQRAVTPGQAIVFYDKSRVIGGAIIK